jgi:hypothetical protein
VHLRQVTIEKSPSASERAKEQRLDSRTGLAGQEIADLCNHGDRYKQLRPSRHITEHHRSLILRQLLDQPEQLLTLHAHDPSVRRQPLIALALRRARCVPDQTVNQGDSRSLTGTPPRALTWAAAAQRAAGRSLPSWSCRFDPGRLLQCYSPGQGQLIRRANESLICRCPSLG